MVWSNLWHTVVYPCKYNTGGEQCKFLFEISFFSREVLIVLCSRPMFCFQFCTMWPGDIATIDNSTNIVKLCCSFDRMQDGTRPWAAIDWRTNSASHRHYEPNKHGPFFFQYPHLLQQKTLRITPQSLTIDNVITPSS